MKKNILLIFGPLFLSLILLLSFFVQPTHATPAPSTLSLDLSTSDLTINMSSSLKTGSFNVNVKTNNSTGYIMTFSDSDEDTRLVGQNPTNPVSFASISTNMQATSFLNNTWGYSLDSLNFKPVPKKSTPEIIKATNSATPVQGDDTSIHIGVKADSSTPPDIYEDSMEISVVTNYAPSSSTFVNGSTFNNHFRQVLAGQPFSEMWFKKSSARPADLTSARIVSTPESDFPIYMWFDTNDKTVYWWSEADTTYLNAESTNMFGNKEQNYGQMNLDLRGANASRVKNMSYMFGLSTGSEKNIKSIDVSDFDTSSLELAESVFSYLIKLSSLDLSSFNTQKVTSMRSMFANTTSLTNLNISSFNTQNVTNMANMFYNSRITSLDLRHFDTSKVTAMNAMFFSTSNLTTLNLSSFDTRQVTNMSHMFSGTAVNSLNLSNFNTQKVTSMHRMFQYAKNLTELDLSSFNTQKVTDMSYMFFHMNNIRTLKLSSFNTSRVSKFDAMFSESTKLTTIFASALFSVGNATSDSNMFHQAPALVGGNGTAYNESNPKGREYARIDRTGAPGYFTSE